MPDGGAALAYPEGEFMDDPHDSPERGLPLPNAPWLVLIAKPGMSEIALMRLGAQGFEAYLPLRAPTREERRRGVERKPMFPGYLFARPGFDGQWSAMENTIGVSRLVMVGDRPALLPDAALRELRSREAADGLVYLPEADAFSPGAPVLAELAAGQLVDAVVEAHEDSDRIALLLRFLGAERRVVVDAARVKPRAAE